MPVPPEDADRTGATDWHGQRSGSTETFHTGQEEKQTTM